MKIAGIVSYDAYVPRYRIDRKTISEAMSWLNTRPSRGEKAVANYDEDSLSMAVAAGFDCLEGLGHLSMDGLYFATTTSPYRERESASIIATALDFPFVIRTADFTNSLKSGTAALLSALDSIKAEESNNILVCASDCRLGKPGSSLEMLFGDGAAAFLLGKERVIAILEGSYSVSHDFPDYRRSEYDKFVKAVEDRFVRENGYTRFLEEVITGLLKKCKVEARDISKIAYPCLDPRDHANIASGTGFRPDQVQEPLIGTIGETGTASPLLLLVAMLEDARPGDKILVASYGNGAQAMLFKITQEIERVKNDRGIRKHLAHKRGLTSYIQYLAFRGIVPVEMAAGDEVAPTQLPLTWRERKSILALYGSRCKRCHTPVYPAQKVCVNPQCGAIKEMEDYSFAHQRGRIYSFTHDQTASVLNPPLTVSMIEFDEGGRFLFEVTDCEPGTLEIGQPVRMTFRRKYQDQSRGLHGYFWKAVPAEV